MALLTYEEVLEITKSNESFKMKHQTVGDTEVAMCTYFLASSGDFFDAHNDGSMVQATELRGITFTNFKNQGWKTHLFIDKFFNLNQTNGSNITNMELIINGNVEICNINKIFSDGTKTFRAIDLKIGMEVGILDRTTEQVGEMFVIETLQKDILPTAKPENSWMYNDVKHLDIIRVANKDDGSAIRFLILNGNLVAKTKFSLEAEQCELAMKIVNANEKLKSFILETLEMGLVALFEVVSPFNKVVLTYNYTTLKLLQIRDENNDGLYLDIYTHPLVEKYNITTAHQEDLEKIKKIANNFTKQNAVIILGDNKFNSLDELSDYLFVKLNNNEQQPDNTMSVLDFLLLSKEYIEEKEGVVVTFENGKMAKIKNDWYMYLHSILSEGLKEHKIIEKVIDGTIDDTIAMIPETNIEERNFIDSITEIIVNHINHTTAEAEKNFKRSWNGNKKELAITYSNTPIFPYIMNFAKGFTYEDVEHNVAERVKFDCRKLEMAKKYLKRLGFNLELKILVDDV